MSLNLEFHIKWSQPKHTRASCWIAALWSLTLENNLSGEWSLTWLDALWNLNSNLNIFQYGNTEDSGKNHDFGPISLFLLQESRSTTAKGCNYHNKLEAGQCEGRFLINLRRRRILLQGLTTQQFNQSEDWNIQSPASLSRNSKSCSLELAYIVDRHFKFLLLDIFRIEMKRHEDFQY